jgi:hypothetical protein
MPLHTSGNVGTVNLNDKNVMFGFNMGGKHELLLNTLIFPASPACGVCISRLIRCARASSNCSDFLRRHLHLRDRLLD